MPPPQIQAAPEYGTLLTGANNSVGFEPRRQPTGSFYWFCVECRRKNVISANDLKITSRVCEHCGLKVEIVFEPVDQVAEPEPIPKPGPAYVPRGRRIVPLISQGGSVVKNTNPPRPSWSR